MNENTLFKSVNLEITKRLNNNQPVWVEEVDEGNYSISFDGVCVVIPKSKVFATEEKMTQRGDLMKNFYPKIISGDYSYLGNVNPIGKDYFIGDNYLYYVPSFGALKGVTFDNAISLIVEGLKLILLRTKKDEPRVLFFCSCSYSLERIGGKHE